ncbi:hypothetical protein [Ornithinibacillus halotolerans]|uniref:Spore coat protein YutH n=1 Tax=Ornithinibacillus halotolerans TaxID=1274357 RepID=A0A916W808_9BACI|nr:hypothetical protein [Ornithinibacillus halotolerans]GGA76695.1 spore coat protein YutH [Ornithinibacillus halotolerans]
MRELLLVNYNIHVTEQVRINGRDGFHDKYNYYFIISATNKEMILLEQAALAYYLTEIGYKHTAIPIPTMGNKWFVEKDNQHYLVLKVEKIQDSSTLTHGQRMAEFHNKSAEYQYEPTEISSYGQWKELWIKKITAYEQKIQLEMEGKSSSNKYYRLLVDMFPYIIGISENAIQYIQESETEKRFHKSDQGVFTFHRYTNDLLQPIIWTDKLVYDHPSRDLAEYIRHHLLLDSVPINEMKQFLIDYQELRPLSVFSWRLLYARLVYPIHLFDFIEKGFNGENVDEYYQDLKQLLKIQNRYENRLSELFDLLDVDYKRYDFPIIKWLD